ncbi:Response regulator receiver domain-containing protein [Verrucomicrobium sp. GAS474]|uniref:response regulator n=1 Tax=Verrucomicrobium sp. GAS474 TaxID=1882831 RepID=UPI00087DE205|nr:response regulator [Verrucomicrobium sp. GAS474]SDU04575.1 Response regulator receiver domain-containing protein [Verrucomicrobium sp. GAS474]
MRVLTVEDDPIVQHVLKGILSAAGHQVVAAKDGSEALRLFQDHPVDLVISAWQLPGGIDGIELCEAIRAFRISRYVYFILVSSGSITASSYGAAVARGVDDFLPKPLDREQIPARILVAERIIRSFTELREVKQLLPICMYCKKIRDDANYWNQIETYLAQQTGSTFSHGVCPTCYDAVVLPEIDRVRTGDLFPDA